MAKAKLKIVKPVAEVEDDAVDIEQVAAPRSRALVFVEHAEKDGAVFPGPNAGVYFRIGGVTRDIDDKSFENYAVNWTRRALGAILSDGDIKEIRRALTASSADQPRQAVYKRRGPAPGGGMYLDLSIPGDPKAVEVTRGGTWRTVPRPVDCDFVRPASQLALPEPKRGGDINQLWTVLNVNPEARPLVLAWLLAALCPQLESQMILTFGGASKAGKSNTTLSLRNLIDPNDADLLAPQRDLESLALDVDSTLVLALDNLSDIPLWFSNALCRCTTGAAWTKRLHYSNKGRMVLRFITPIIINGIETLADRDDLLNRSLVVDLDPIDQEDRLSPAQIREKIRDIQPFVLGCLLDALAAGMTSLGGHGSMKGALTRDPDFDRLIKAAEPALGLEPGAFARSYTRMESSNREIPLNACPIYKPLAAWLADLRNNPAARRGRAQSAGGPAMMEAMAAAWNGQLVQATRRPAALADGVLWSGTAGEILGKLTNDETKHTKKWPSEANQVGGMLRRIAEAMKLRDGIETIFTRDEERLVTFRVA